VAGHTVTPELRSGDPIPPLTGAPLRLQLTERGEPVTMGGLAPLPERRPAISCLMVTADRPEQARLSIACFARQTYPERELVVVDNGADAAASARLAEIVREADGAPAPIRLISAPAGALSLGELRNLSVEHAQGAYLATWDDDDLSDPLRLAVEFRALVQTGSQACALSRALVWCPKRRLLAARRVRFWENTMLCERGALPRYEPLARSEDRVAVDAIIASARMAYIDHPRLYVYVGHAANTTGFRNFMLHWGQSNPQLSGEAYEALLAELAERMPVTAYAELEESRPDNWPRFVFEPRPDRPTG
jgi:hypothetical protein